MQFNLRHENLDDRGTFQGSGADGLDTFTINGNLAEGPKDGWKTVQFIKSYDRKMYGEMVSWNYRGILDVESSTIEGDWWGDNTDVCGTFRIGRSPAFAHEFRYSKQEFVDSPARARWKFALEAIIHLVRQQMWSWAYFAHRRSLRKRFLELYRRRELTNSWYLPEETLSEEQTTELVGLERNLPPADARMYHSLGQVEIRTLCVHL